MLSPFLSKIWKKKDKNSLINNKLNSSQLTNKKIPITNQNTPSSRVYPGALQRKVIIPTNQKTGINKPLNKKSQEVEDVLKKLKDMSK